MKALLKLAFAAAAPLLLVGCLLAPGKFVSSLDVAKNGSFTFRYKGEILLVNNKSFAEAMNGASEFSPSCQDEDGDERACTAAEVAEQRRQFDAEQAERAEREAKESAQAAAMFGGLDPNNSATMDEFAAKLQREIGWKSVVHRGDGVFDVDYEISGTLERDFIFPIFPRIDFIAPFVVVTRRDDGALLLRAPALGDAHSGPASMPGAAMGDGASKAEGTFTLTTDATIATNNSEEGPVSQGGKQRVEWHVTPLNRTAPEALLRL